MLDADSLVTLFIAITLLFQSLALIFIALTLQKIIKSMRILILKSFLGIGEIKKTVLLCPSKGDISRKHSIESEKSPAGEPKA